MNFSKISNLQAEVELLGSILVKNDYICDVIDFLEPEDFYNTKNKIIYKKIKELYENNNLPVDVVNLADSLGDKLKEIGGMTYVSQIVGSNVSCIGVRKHGEIIKEKSNKRKLLKIFNTAGEKIRNEDVSWEGIMDYAQNGLLSIKGVDNDESGDIAAAMNEFMDTIEERYAKDGNINEINSGYTKIDKMLGGFGKQDLIIIAGRPSMGKTAMALNIIANTAIKCNSTTAFFNLEMGRKQITDRLVSVCSKVPMENIKKAFFRDKEMSHIFETASVLCNTNIRIYEKTFTLNGIKRECKRLKLKVGLNIVVIDYLQLLDSGERCENRNQDISKITRKLKLMAKELDITLILLSQLSRAPECRSDHRPMLSDLRESGSIEQDADIVMFLYRDEYYNKHTESKGIIECIVSKNRNGETGTAKLRWRPQVQSIEER